jgi:hypothetical protein
LTDPLIVARAIHFASAIMIVGIGVFEALVAGPALECAAPAAGIATSFRARMAGFTWAGLAVALVSGGVWLLLLAAKIADKSVYEVTTDGTAWIVLTKTRSGSIGSYGCSRPDCWPAVSFFRSAAESLFRTGFLSQS